MVEKEDLGKALAQVESLKRDLSVEIPEEGHYETVRESVPKWLRGDEGRRENPSDYEHEVWVVDRPAKPDTQKREAARQQLQQIYESSEWYSAMYEAGKILGIPYEELNKIINLGLEDLTKRLKSTKNENRRVKVDERYESETLGRPEHSDDRRGGDFYYHITIPVYGEKEFTLVEQENRLRAIEDADLLLQISGSKKVKDFLQAVFLGNHNSSLDNGLDDVNEEGLALSKGFSSKVRIQAGKALGYSALRIWSHEHPVGAIVSGIVVAGAASSLGYLIYQYLTR